MTSTPRRGRDTDPHGESPRLPKRQSIDHSDTPNTRPVLQALSHSLSNMQVQSPLFGMPPPQPFAQPSRGKKHAPSATPNPLASGTTKRRRKPRSQGSSNSKPQQSSSCAPSTSAEDKPPDENKQAQPPTSDPRSREGVDPGNEVTEKKSRTRRRKRAGSGKKAQMNRAMPPPNWFPPPSYPAPPPRGMVPFMPPHNLGLQSMPFAYIHYPVPRLHIDLREPVEQNHSHLIIRTHELPPPPRIEPDQALQTVLEEEYSCGQEQLAIHANAVISAATQHWLLSKSEEERRAYLQSKQCEPC